MGICLEGMVQYGWCNIVEYIIVMKDIMVVMHGSI